MDMDMDMDLFMSIYEGGYMGISMVMGVWMKIDGYGNEYGVGYDGYGPVFSLSIVSMT